MKLNFKRLSVANFRSFDDKANISFEPGLHFVRGDNQDEPRLEANGAGKSSLFDALCWVLYGKTVKNLRNTDVTPWSGAEPTEVTLVIEVDTQDHKIARTINPNNLTLDGKRVGQDDIVTLIGMDFEVFNHAILFGQGQPLFFDKTPSEKMQVLSDVLQLERWEERSKFASNRVSNLETRKAQFSGQASGMSDTIQNMDGLINDAKRRRDQWEIDRAVRMTDKTAERERLERELERVVKQWGTAELSYDGAATEAKALAVKLADQVNQLSAAKLTLDNAHAQVAGMKAAIKKSEKLKICPTCGQAIDTKAMAKHLKHAKEALRTAEDDKTLAQNIASLTTKVGITRDHLTTFRSREEEAAAKLRTLTPQKAQLETKIAELRKVSQGQREEINPYIETHQSLRKQQQALEAELQNLKDEMTKCESAIERAKFWVKGFKDVRLFIIEELLSELEIVTNTMLEDMGLVGWSISYDIEKETKSGTFQRGINVEVHSTRNPKPVRWEVWCGGESQRLRLIGSLALSEVLLNEANVHPNLEILDEPSRGLTSGGLQDLVDMLADRADQTGKTILFVDHHLIRSGRFTSTIHVTRDKKGSRVRVAV